MILIPKLLNEYDILIRKRNLKTNRKSIIHKIEIITYPFPSKAFQKIRYNNKNSLKVSKMTPTEIGSKIRTLLKLELANKIKKT